MAKYGSSTLWTPLVKSQVVVIAPATPEYCDVTARRFIQHGKDGSTKTTKKNNKTWRETGNKAKFGHGEQVDSKQRRYVQLVLVHWLCWHCICLSRACRQCEIRQMVLFIHGAPMGARLATLIIRQHSIAFYLKLIVSVISPYLL